MFCSQRIMVKGIFQQWLIGKANRFKSHEERKRYLRKALLQVSNCILGVWSLLTQPKRLLKYVKRYLAITSSIVIHSLKTRLEASLGLCIAWLTCYSHPTLCRFGSVRFGSVQAGAEVYMQYARKRPRYKYYTGQNYSVLTFYYTEIKQAKPRNLTCLHN